jgi:hypothetical protein
MPDCEEALGRICSGTEIALPDCGTVRVTLSAGVFNPTFETNIAKALSFADRALYQSKAAGRAKYTLADTAVQADRPYGGQILSSALG